MTARTSAARAAATVTDGGKPARTRKSTSAAAARKRTTSAKASTSKTATETAEVKDGAEATATVTRLRTVPAESSRTVPVDKRKCRFCGKTGLRGRNIVHDECLSRAQRISKKQGN